MLLGFKVSMIPYSQNATSCFLEDIDPISKIFKNLLNRTLGLLGARLFQNSQKKWICDFLIFLETILFEMIWDFLGSFEVS